MSQSVHTYFRQELNADPQDDTLHDLPVDSGCGDDCKAAIDAAAAYLKMARMAGSSMEIRDALVENVRRTVSIFWHG